MQRIAFEAIGTHWEIDLYIELREAELQTLRQAVLDRIDQFDQVYSRFRPDSLVTAISRQAGEYSFPDDAEQLFEVYTKLYNTTGAKVTPTIGQLMSQSGYDAEYSLYVQPSLTSAPKWVDVMEYNHPTLRTHQPVLLDFGAAGKGYLIDIIGQLLVSRGITDFLIDAGGDLLHQRTDGVLARIGLEHPLDPKQVIGVVELGNQSICASAGNRRQWAGRHHIVDPDTTDSIQDVLASWVVADAAVVADGLATALFFVAPSVLLEHYSFEYVIVRSDLTYQTSPGLQAEIFSGVQP